MQNILSWSGKQKEDLDEENESFDFGIRQSGISSNK